MYVKNSLSNKKKSSQKSSVVTLSAATLSNKVRTDKKEQSISKANLEFFYTFFKTFS